MRNQAPVIGFLLFAALGAAASAAEFKTLTLADATELTYALALPDDFDAAQTYPVLLALPPGPQTKDMVNAGLDSYWEAEGTSRGYIVVSPVAPGRQLFFQGGEKALPELMDHITQTYGVAGEKFHSLTVVPGFPPTQEVFDRLASIAGLTISMFVGEQDSGWLDPMNGAVAALKRAGNDVYIEVIPNNGHFVTALSGRGAARLFDQMER